jgi:hypothetical protein
MTPPRMSDVAAITRGFLIEAGCHCVTDPQEADLPVFDAAMMYPDDAERRADYQTTLECGVLIKAARAGGSLIRPEVAMAMLNATPIREFHRGAIERRHKGPVSGWILVEGISRLENGEPKAAMKSIYGDAADQFRSSLGIGPREIEKAWGKLKSVSHLWAVRVQMSRAGDDQKCFPCDPANLPKFLMQVEDVRRRAVALRTKQSSHGALITSDEFARLPDHVVSQFENLQEKIVRNRKKLIT